MIYRKIAFKGVKKLVKKNMREWGNFEGSVEFVKSQLIPHESKLLDIGCNTGSTIFKLHICGFSNAYGIDVDKLSIRKGRQAYDQISDRLIDYDGVKLPFGDNSFDVVTMFDVIEHINNINEFLSGEVRRVLKNRGRFLFQTPNIYTNIPWEIFIHKSMHKYKEYHVSLQSYSSLIRLLESAGFVEILIEKRDIRTPYYLRELRKYIGPFAYPVLSVGNLLPVRCATNFWGCCHKSS